MVPRLGRLTLLMVCQAAQITERWGRLSCSRLSTLEIARQRGMRASESLRHLKEYAHTKESERLDCHKEEFGIGHGGFI